MYYRIFYRLVSRLSLYENLYRTCCYINRDDMLDLCIELKILGIPSFIAYDKGQELGRLVSKLRKTEEEVQSFIDSI